MVARPYLRTPRTKIVQTAHLVQRKRHELVAAIAKGLVPPDTSPATKKKKNFRIDVRTYTVGLGDVTYKTVVLKNYEPVTVCFSASAFIVNVNDDVLINPAIVTSASSLQFPKILPWKNCVGPA